MTSFILYQCAKLNCFVSPQNRIELFILLENRSKKMLNKQTVQTIGIQAEALEKRINMNKQRKLPKKDEWQNAENRSFDCHRNAEARLSRFFLSPANS